MIGLNKYLKQSNMKLLWVGLFSLGLIACSGDKDSDLNEANSERPRQIPELNPAGVIDGPLVKAGQKSVRQFLINGIFSASLAQSTGDTENISQPTPTQSPLRAEFSTTNTQEMGVDEADRIEYDGNILYLANHRQWYGQEPSTAQVRVLERLSDFSLNQLAELSLTDEQGNIEGLYLAENRLAVLSVNAPLYSFDILPLVPDPWQPNNQKFAIDIYDTQTPSNPLLVSQIQLDGALVSSRRINNHLYVVSSYTAHVEGLNPNAKTDQELLANFLAIWDTPDSDLMPKIYIDGDKGQALNLPEDCAIPQNASEKDGYAQLLSIVRIDLSQPNDYQATCISSMAHALYMSFNNLYISAAIDNHTLLHKVALQDNLPYQATGKVSGQIFGRGPANLRLSEFQNHLRVVTSDYASGEPEHKLFILAQQGNQLSPIATLPNDAAPEPIGKPGEDIYAVRFFADKAYIVTFERIDPLYVIDLSNPQLPNVIGALEIPGFSSYLHPLAGGYLLGVGQQVNSMNIGEDGEATSQPVTPEGMKVSLFDITDPANPTEVASIVKPDSYTPVEYDYRALSVRYSQDFYQFALPLESWQQTDSERQGFWTASNSLLLLEVSTEHHKPSLTERAVISPPVSAQPYIHGWQDRSVIHGQNVYYVRGNQVWQSVWEDNPEMYGPY
ncbi:beta-propeller domain-containing protein [Paraglaciecola aestuariivivens]